MGAPDVINDIKVIFLIVNTIVGLHTALLSISVAVTRAVLGVDGMAYGTEAVTFAYITIGLIALGYTGTIRQNRIMLFVYTGVMVLAAVLDIWQMMYSGAALSFATSLTHLCLVVMAIILALILAVKSRNQSNQGMIPSPPPAAYTPVA